MRRRRTLKSRMTRIASVSWHERALLAEAIAGLMAARIKLALIPFPKLAPGIGTFVPAADPRAAERTSARDASQAETAREVGWAVTRAANHVPFGAVCLPQAMAAHAMLRRRGIASAMHFGAKLGTDRAIDAHAWLEAVGVEVTGYPVDAETRAFGCFV